MTFIRYNKLTHLVHYPNLAIACSLTHRPTHGPTYHVGCPSVPGEPAHEDNTAPVHPHHLGEKLSQAPHLAH